jgi:hypothetical protein
MRVLARRVKLSNVAAVQCPHHADARHHDRAVELDDREQGLYRGLPLLEMLLGLGELLNVFGGVLEGTIWRPRGRGMGLSYCGSSPLL